MAEKKTKWPNRPVVEVCPKCGAPEADGAYCDECGWYRPNPNCPHCRKEARKK